MADVCLRLWLCWGCGWVLVVVRVCFLLGLFLLCLHVLCGWGLYGLDGEFDPGSGRTLAVCLTHASRAERPFFGYSSGERVSNTWVTCPWLQNNSEKSGLMLDMTRDRMVCAWKDLVRLGMGSRPISLLVG